MDAVVLNNIEPFNDIFYQDCFYNSFFPIVRHFGKSIETFLYNNLTLYTTNNKDSALNFGVKYKYIKSLDLLMQEVGLDLISKVVCYNPIASVQNSILNRRPVIIWVDCFYESIRNDTYLKTHFPHTLLLYGYDSKREIINVIEHKQRDNLSYEKKVISNVDFVNSYYGYIKNFKNNSENATYFEFFEKENHDLNANDTTKNMLNTYKRNFLSEYDNITEGLRYLKQFLNGFRCVLFDADSLSKNIEGMVSVLNNIVNAKYVEKYKLQSLFCIDSEIVKVNDELIGCWLLVRQLAAKYMYSSIYNEAELKKIAGNIDRICDLEYKYIHEIKNEFA